MRSLVFFLASTADLAFHDWCNFVGIETPTVRLLTTSRSVAGRGVFATGIINQGDAAIKIPGDVVLHGFTASFFFPELASDIRAKKKNFRKRNKWWRRLVKRQKDSDYEFTDTSDLWQAELTKYSLECIASDNFWAPWIKQWQRSDPMQRLYEKNVLPDEEEKIMECVKELKTDFIPQAGLLQIRAAVDIRLRRFEEMKEILGLDETSSTMYGFVTSRAIDLGDGVSAIIPMFDMVNHSADPNLVLSFIKETDTFELRARRDIFAGEELFLSYQDEEHPSVEYSALWAAVQWGIPTIDPSKPLFGTRLQALDV